MYISLAAFLLIIACSTACDTECTCDEEEYIAHCQGDPDTIKLLDTGCDFKPRTIIYEPCGSIKPPYSTTVSHLKPRRRALRMRPRAPFCSPLRLRKPSAILPRPRNKTKRLTKTKRTTTTLLTTTPIVTPIPHSTTTLPTLSYDRPTKSKPVKLTKPPKPAETFPPTLPPTLHIPEPATLPLPPDSEPYPMPQDSEPLQPPNMERHQQTSYSISDTWAEVWGPIAGGLGLAGGGVMLVRRRRRQQRRANLSRLMLRLHDGNSGCK